MMALITVKILLKITSNLAAGLQRNAEEKIRRNVQRKSVLEGFSGFLKMRASRTHPGLFNVISVFGAIIGNVNWMNMFCVTVREVKKTFTFAPSATDMSRSRIARDSRNMMLKNTVMTNTNALIVLRPMAAWVVNSI